MRDHRAVGCSAEDAMTAIGELVARLVAAGTPPELAAVVVSEAFAIGATTGQVRGHPVDESAERRRAYDRERQRIKRENLRKSAEVGGCPDPALSLSSIGEGKEPLKEKKKKPAKHPLPPDYQPKQSHFEQADRLQVPHSFVHEQTEDMRLWALSSGEMKADWDATLHGFMRRNAGRFNGERTRQNGSTSTARPRAVAQDVIIAGMADALSERPDSRLGGGCARGRGESETRHSHDPPELSPNAGGLFDDRKASG
jgi:hypothetical protein